MPQILCLYFFFVLKLWFLMCDLFFSSSYDPQFFFVHSGGILMVEMVNCRNIFNVAPHFYNALASRFEVIFGLFCSAVLFHTVVFDGAIRDSGNDCGSAPQFCDCALYYAVALPRRIT